MKDATGQVVCPGASACRRSGRHPRGERHGRAKLSDRAVMSMRTLAAAGARQADLAREFRVSEALVSYIVRGLRRCP